MVSQCSRTDKRFLKTIEISKIVCHHFCFQGLIVDILLKGTKGDLLGIQEALLRTEGFLLGTEGALLETQGALLWTQGGLLGTWGVILGTHGALLEHGQP